MNKFYTVSFVKKTYIWDDDDAGNNKMRPIVDKEIHYDKVFLSIEDADKFITAQDEFWDMLHHCNDNPPRLFNNSYVFLEPNTDEEWEFKIKTIQLPNGYKIIKEDE
jgi:hypothetical protein